MGLKRIKRDKIYERLKDKYGHVYCYVCDKRVSKKDATIEHIIPRSKGGNNHATNLAISHHKCNEERSNIMTSHEFICILFHRLERVMRYEKEITNWRWR